MMGWRRKRTLEALRLSVIDSQRLRVNLHNSDTILRRVWSGGRAQLLEAPRLEMFHWEAFL
jgi:hypothetical protein